MKKKILMILVIFLIALPAYAGCTFSVSGSNTTITCTFTQPTAKMTALLGDASNQIWNEGCGRLLANPLVIVPYNSLTNQQKLNIVSLGIKNFIVDKARTFNNSTIDSVDY